MSAQEFKPGDRVRLIDGTSPISGHEGTREFTVEEVFAEAPRVVRLAGVEGVRGRDRFEKVEPEDKDDLYVEPEPLKAGDHVLAWAKVAAPEPDFDGDIKLWVYRAGKATGDAGAETWVRPDAIVRPDAGQVPPWVKPARCTSLYDSGAGNSLMRCEGEVGHRPKHVVGWVAWTDAEAYGRVEVSS